MTFEFTEEQEKLLKQIKKKCSDSTFWNAWTENKITALVNLYGGYFPDVHKRDEKLVIEYSKKLVNYCEENHHLFPSELKENNPIIEKYKKIFQDKEILRIKLLTEEKKRHQRRDNDRESFFAKTKIKKHKRLPIYPKKNKLIQELPPHAPRKDTAFLIEGFKGCNDNIKFPEIVTGTKLAKTNGCQIFDSISSFDDVHIAEMLKNVDEKTQKTIVSSIYLAFINEGAPQKIIDKIIRPPFQYLVKNKNLDKTPEWLDKLNALSANDFAQSVLNEYFKGNVNLFKEKHEKLKKEMVELSNKISQQQFVKYLKENPSVTKVYGLIGAKHLSMLNNIGEVIVKENNHYYVQTNIDNRIVNIHLFGGCHGKEAHYNNMVEFIKKTEKDFTIVKPQTDSMDLNMLLNTLSISAPKSKRNIMTTKEAIKAIISMKK